MPHPGQFVWYELMTRNLTAAQEFYGAVVGWHFTPWEGGDGVPYLMMSRTSDPKDSLGGLMEMREPEFPKELPTHFMGYISVDSADDTAAQVRELGGTVIHGPEDIPKVGRFAILADPQGAAFAVLQSLNNEWEKEPATIGDVSWVELSTTDHEAAFGFYQALFGWEVKVDMDMGGGNIYRLVSCPGSPAEEASYGFGGMFTRTADMPGPTAWTYFFWVADLNASLQTATALGGTILIGPMDVPGGSRVAYLTDPEGTVFALQGMGAA